MSITIDDVPEYQVLSVSAGTPSYLSVFVGGLESGPDGLRAQLGGTDSMLFQPDPAVWDSSPTGVPNQYLLVLELIGASGGGSLEGWGDCGIKLPQDPAFTVTIISTDLGSDTSEVVAIFINPQN